MKLHPKVDDDQILTELRRSAVALYGEQRTEELSSQLEHLASMMARTANQPLDLTDAPLSRDAERSRGAK